MISTYGKKSRNKPLQLYFLGITQLALVACIECGSNVSDKAPSCPQCGVSNPSGKNLSGQLVVRRQFALYSALVSIEVFADRVVVGKVKNGGELAVKLPVGQHELTFEYTGLNRAFDLNERHGERSGGARIQINHNETTTIEIKSGFTGLYIVKSSSIT